MFVSSSVFIFVCVQWNLIGLKSSTHLIGFEVLFLTAHIILLSARTDLSHITWFGVLGSVSLLIFLYNTWPRSRSRCTQLNLT